MFATLHTPVSGPESTSFDVENGYRPCVHEAQTSARAEQGVSARGSQEAELRHDMANILSLLQLRLTLLKKAHRMSDSDAALFEQNFARMCDLLDCWKRLDGSSVSGCELRDAAFDFCEVVTQIADTYYPIFTRKHQTFRLFVRQVPARVTGPRNLYERLIDNLISNASKYTPCGGKLGIMARVRASRIHIVVYDTGIGMTAEEIKHIFDPYYRTTNARQLTSAGSGLGLHIVKSIVDSLDGEITVRSTIGQGSTVVVTLPNRCE